MSKQLYFKQFSLAQVHYLVLFDLQIGLLGATTQGQSGPESDGNERVLGISQSSSITHHQIVWGVSSWCNG